MGSYISHLSHLTYHNFYSLEGIWRDFWSFASGRKEETAKENSEDEEKRFKIGGKFKMRFRTLLESETVQSFILQADFICYQQLVEFLLPKVIKKPHVPVWK